MEYKSGHERTRGRCPSCEFSYLYSGFSSIVPTCSRTTHLSTRHSAAVDPGNELKWVWNNRGTGPVQRRLERGGRVPRAEKEPQVTRENGREREKQETQGPYESKDEMDEGGGGRRSVEGLCGEKRVYVWWYERAGSACPVSGSLISCKVG